MIQKTDGLFSAKILRDSVSPSGVRLVTAEVILPRMILSEFNTHRILSKNSASSRAIPVRKQLEKVFYHPYIPSFIGVNRSGMQASEWLEGEKLEEAQRNVLLKRDRSLIGALEDLLSVRMVKNIFGEERLSRIMVNGMEPGMDHSVFWSAVDTYTELEKKKREGIYMPEDFLNIHKQTVNRYLEPFLMQTIVVTGTEWSNLMGLRVNEEAQKEIAIPVRLLQEAMEDSTPQRLEYGQFHLPLIQDDEMEEAQANPERWCWISSARCARTSYETHDGIRDPEKDYILGHDRLEPSGHMSPFEHVAEPMEDANAWSGNFRGWKQFRKTLEFESDYSQRPTN